GPRRHAGALFGVEDDGFSDDAAFVRVDDAHLQPVRAVDAYRPGERGGHLLRERELLAQSDRRPAHALVDEGEGRAAVHVGWRARELSAERELAEDDSTIAVLRERHLHAPYVRGLAHEAVRAEAPARVLERLDRHGCRG